MIFAGAVGNIIDSVFYGVIFNTNFYGVAQLFPKGGGYAQLLHGRVVDMLYFHIFEFYLPSWIPFVGGNKFVFFDPVFNIADSSITMGVLFIILFQKRFFKHDTSAKPATETPTQPTEITNEENPINPSAENHINNNIDN
jgi:signal peptidase II